MEVYQLIVLLAVSFMLETVTGCHVRCPRVHITYCCNVQQTLPNAPVFRCSNAFLKDVLMGHPDIPGPCSIECQLHAKGIIVGDVLNLTNVDEDWRSAYERCDPLAKEKMVKVQAFKNCSAFPYLMEKCVQRQMLLTCPNEKWNSDDTWCELARRKASECSDPNFFFDNSNLDIS